jgi:thiamine-phosphate pyrophosphorylase
MTRIRCDGKGGIDPQLSVPGPGTPVSLVRHYSPVDNVRGVQHPSASPSTGPSPDARTRLAAARLYLCTDARRERGDLAEFAEAALAGGVDIIQLRDKGSAGEQRFGPLEARAELAALDVLADAARRHGALLAVNDRADIARAAGADVLHLGQDDLPLSVARDIIGPGPVIGRSTHDAEQVAAAAADAIDYFCVGPCWPTPTKPGRTAPGLDLVRAAAQTATDMPWFAIGGIDAERLPEVLDAGARRIVVVRAITAADDPEAAARELRAAVTARD